MTAAKFKPLTFSVSSFALSIVANIFVFMILDYFCLLIALFCYVIINVQNFETILNKVPPFATKLLIVHLFIIITPHYMFRPTGRPSSGAI
jgi:type III secretory pathway component EscS